MKAGSNLGRRSDAAPLGTTPVAVPGLPGEVSPASIEQDFDWLLLSGRTYRHREAISREGASWFGPGKAWVMPAGKAARSLDFLARMQAAGVTLEWLEVGTNPRPLEPEPSLWRGDARARPSLGPLSALDEPVDLPPMNLRGQAVNLRAQAAKPSMDLRTAIDKAQKLIALGGSDNPHEAARAKEAAQRLLAPHGLTMEKLVEYKRIESALTGSFGFR